MIFYTDLSTDDEIVKTLAVMIYERGNKPFRITKGGTFAYALELLQKRGYIYITDTPQKDPCYDVSLTEEGKNFARMILI